MKTIKNLAGTIILSFLSFVMLTHAKLTTNSISQKNIEICNEEAGSNCIGGDGGFKN